MTGDAESLSVTDVGKSYRPIQYAATLRHNMASSNPVSSTESRKQDLMDNDHLSQTYLRSNAMRPLDNGFFQLSSFKLCWSNA